MELIQNWKMLQRMGNYEFEQGQWQNANHYYMNSILLLRGHLSDILKNQHEQASEVIICLSIAVQNLSETYNRQNRVNCCVSLLSRALHNFQQLQNTLSSDHPAAIALLREGCKLRQLMFTYKETEEQTMPMNGTTVAGYDTSAYSRLH